MRLTKVLKKAIVNSVVKAACEERMNQLNEDFIDFGQRVLDELTGEDNLKIMKSLPGKFFRSR